MLKKINEQKEMVKSLEENPKILAAIIAMVVGILSRNIIATIFAGLASYWTIIFI